jgi:hypothetical protein
MSGNPRDSLTGRFIRVDSLEASRLRRLYIEELLTAREIARTLGVSEGCVLYSLRKFEIPRRHGGAAQIRDVRARPAREVLERLIHTEHRRYVDIAARYGVSMSTVGNWVHHFELGPVSAWTTRLGHEPQLPTPQQLVLYAAGASLFEIGLRFGISEPTVASLCRRAGVQIRSGGWSGQRRFASADGHKVRSTYELRVDAWLLEHRVEHFYEPRVPGHPRYSADFLANGWYVEIWGVKRTPAHGSRELAVSYNTRRAKKVDFYRAQGLPLIEIEEWAFQSRLDGLWQRRLSRCLTPSLSEEQVPYCAA